MPGRGVRRVVVEARVILSMTPSAPPVVPLHGLTNRGNTCWASACVQSMRGLPGFRRKCCAGKQTPFARAMAPGELPDTLVPHLFRWCRSQLKHAEGQGHRQADPAELLVELLDTSGTDVDTTCFESQRVKRYECQECGHVRRVTTQETMLILPMLPEGVAPVRRAVDLEFGYLKPPAPADAVDLRGGAAPPSVEHAEYECDRDAAWAETNTTKERWWRCDDGYVQEVMLSSATPYVLFYEEVDEEDDDAADMELEDEEEEEDDDAHLDSPPAPAAAVPATPVQYQTLPLDCDEGKCQGARREHTVFVESYELGSNLVIHLACPRPMDMRHVERTLVTKSDTRAKSYVLRSFIARVGGCHYVAYTRKC